MSRRRRRLLIVIALICVVLAWRCLVARPLTIGTFNIRTFPGEATDLERVAQAIAELDADAFTVQEIIDPVAFDRVLTRANILSGRSYQATLAPARCLRNKLDLQLGVVHDTRRLTAVEHHFLGDVSCPPGQPAGMVALFNTSGDERLALTSIHFAAGDRPEHRTQRAAQWQWLLRALPGLHSRLGAPVIVAGDFNSTGFLHDGDPERALIDALVDQHDLQLPTRTLDCSMYWRRTSKEYDISLLDHVLAPREMDIGAPKVLGMCAALACEPQTNAPTGFDAISDHCPVRVDIRL